jgi:outer membrane protein OmpA-like peptidoglycan-associated protein
MRPAVDGPPEGDTGLKSQDMSTRKTLLAVVLACGAFAVFAAFTWIRIASHDRQVANLNEQLERMTSRMDLLTEVVEAASARAIRAEENATIAAEARAKAQTSADEALAALAEAERIRQERETDLNRLEQALGALVETRRTALGLVMNLGSEAIQFDFDRSDLQSDNRELLSRIAGVLLTAKGYSIYVYGHTDDVGTDEYNRGLSERRARAVRDYLVKAGLDSGIITTRGYGKSSPRLRSTSAEARAKNRRVEIGIVDVALEVKGEVR